MNESLKALVAWCAVCLAATSAFAADTPAEDAQRRDRLATERAAARARHDVAVHECQKAFAVTGCVNQAKVERRAALDRIAREEAMLDDAQRRRRADERRQRIAQKQQAAAARAAASAPDVRLRVPRQTAPAASVPPRPSHRAEPRSADAEAAEAAAAKERAAQSQQRRERAAAHEEAVRKRNEERATRKPPAAPLPQASAPASGR